MATYNVTITRTTRIMHEIEADDDEEACDLAEILFDTEMDTDTLKDEDPEYDYSLCDKGGRILVDWM